VTGNRIAAFRSGRRIRSGLTFLCLLTCTLQTFIAQTHFHAPKSGVAHVAGIAEELPGGQAFSLTGDGDPSRQHSRDHEPSCPLCQIVLHGGAAPLPATTFSMLLPPANSVVCTARPLFGTIAAVSYSWQSRGPPLA
jgi:hypothetical protein